jgi:hypothetical protein
MPADSLRDAMDAIRTRLQAELDAQLAGLADRQAAELAQAQAASQAEIERRIAETRAASQVELERRLAETNAAAQAELERRLAETKAVSQVEVERRLADVRAEVEAEAERRVAAARDAALGPGSLVHAFKTIDAAQSVSAILSAITAAVSAASPGSSLYLGPAEAPSRWPAGAGPGARPDSPVAEVIRTGQTAKANGSLIVPLLLDGTAVAAVEVDLGLGQTSSEMIDALARYGSARLGYVTALRTGQARRWIEGSAPLARTGIQPGPSEGAARQNGDPGGEDPAQAARRFARLLVSEIKLYNEAALRAGRDHRDVSRRLSAEIDRARQTYEARVPSTVPDRDRYFHHELVQTLAGGDPSLLG